MDGRELEIQRMANSLKLYKWKKTVDAADIVVRTNKIPVGQNPVELYRHMELSFERIQEKFARYQKLGQPPPVPAPANLPHPAYGSSQIQHTSQAPNDPIGVPSTSMASGTISNPSNLISKLCFFLFHFSDFSKPPKLKEIQMFLEPVLNLNRLKK